MASTVSVSLSNRTSRLMPCNLLHLLQFGHEMYRPIAKQLALLRMTDTVNVTCFATFPLCCMYPYDSMDGGWLTAHGSSRGSRCESIICSPLFHFHLSKMHLTIPLVACDRGTGISLRGRISTCGARVRWTSLGRVEER